MKEQKQREMSSLFSAVIQEQLAQTLRGNPGSFDGQVYTPEKIYELERQTYLMFNEDLLPILRTATDLINTTGLDESVLSQPINIETSLELSAKGVINTLGLEHSVPPRKSTKNNR